MKSKNINYLFSAMVIASLVITFTLFKVWNPSKVQNIAVPENNLTDYSFDFCHISDSDIVVQGWALVKGSEKTLTTVYAEKNSGMVILQKSTQSRPDVSKAYRLGKTYDNSGFVATKRIFNPDIYTGKIIIISNAENGDRYVATHQCK